MTESVQWQALEAVQTVIAGLSLSGISATGVVVEPDPTDQARTRPFVAVFPAAPEEVPPDGGDNARDQVIYKFYVALVAGRDLTNAKLLLKWREQIRQAFHNKRPFSLTGATLDPITVRTGAPIDRTVWRDLKLAASTLFLDVPTLEVRA